MTLGPLMLDIESETLSAEDEKVLRNPLVGGVILFSRNYSSPEQLIDLTAQIHGLRRPPLLIAVDQEGGRVQRFREGFLELPPLHWIGRQYDLDVETGLHLARSCGFLMAAELRAHGVDFSFAPVLDIDYGLSEVIGDRAFHRDPEAVSALGLSYLAGMRDAGMSGTGKHFPGHGAVTLDSHLALPVDKRQYADILDDCLPFERLIHGGLHAVMPAHVIYSDVDDKSAGFSRPWIEGELRGRLDFRGVVFSDDLSMKATECMGDMPARARAALAAGCDMILVCNDRPAALEVLASLGDYSDPVSQVRLVRMHGGGTSDPQTLYRSAEWTAALADLRDHLHKPELTLDS